jgi:NIMA (never in mitosis gene a)-related kinase
METPGSSLADFTLEQELGRGSFGVVFKAVSLRDGQTYCIKKISVTHMTPKHQHDALQEVNILKKLDHPNVVKYYANFMEDNCICIVMEYAQGGDLQKLIRSYRDRRKNFTEGEVWKFAKELSQALCCLHSRNIIHRDVKCLNVLLGTNNQVKLGDLGASKIIEAAQMQATRVGTPLYLAPELVRQLPYDLKVDIWGMGCVMYQVCCLEAPFSGDNLLSLGHSIVNARPKAIPSAYTAKLSQLIFRLLEKRPRERPTIAQVMAMIPGAQRTRLEPAPAPQDMNELSTELTNRSAREDPVEVKPLFIKKSESEGVFKDPKPQLRRLPSREVFNRTLPEIKEEVRPATTEGLQRAKGTRVISPVKVRVSDLKEHQVPDFSDSSIVYPRPISPVKIKIEFPLREKFPDAVQEKEPEILIEEVKHPTVQPVRRPSTAVPRSRVIFKDPSEQSSKLVRPTSAYNPTRSSSLLYRPRVLRHLLRPASATVMSTVVVCPAYKKKVSVADLHMV